MPVMPFAARDQTVFGLWDGLQREVRALGEVCRMFILLGRGLRALFVLLVEESAP